MAINICFFKNNLDIGVQFNTLFCPFPCVALMLIITAVSCVSKVRIWLLTYIMQLDWVCYWWVGYWYMNWYSFHQWGILEEHLHVFNEFADYCCKNGCPDLVMKLLEQMNDHGWWVHWCFISSALSDFNHSIYAGADLPQKEVSCQMTPIAFAAAIAKFNECNDNFDNE